MKKNIISGDSLSGQNEKRRLAGVGLSPTLPTKKRTALWQKLRTYDRRIDRLRALIRHNMTKEEYNIPINNKEHAEYCVKYLELDQERKQIRYSLKGVKKF